LAPAGTPRPIRDQISKEVARTLDLADIKQRLQAMGATPAPRTPDEHDKFLRAQIETISKLVVEAGLKAK
ncbi:MAG: tripartite tricarboxylate transporter substrate binding protein, partial [Betaproteobacteria bacterium]|nr:tripartite tricarboxylate transporter substrate binding protein [Betaproteobacteria bacterium]